MAPAISGSASASVRQRGGVVGRCHWFLLRLSAGVRISAASISRSDRSGADAGRPRTACRATASRISSARPNATMRPPIERTLASLCCARQARGIEIVAQRGADAGTLLAAICSPWPLPPSTMPRSARPSATARPTRDADRRIVHRRLAVRAVIVDRVPERCERPSGVP